jgi:hypothetical protein
MTFTLDTSTLAGPGESETYQPLVDWGNWVRFRIEQGDSEDKDLTITRFYIEYVLGSEKGTD